METTSAAVEKRTHSQSYRIPLNVAGGVEGRSNELSSLQQFVHVGAKVDLMRLAGLVYLYTALHLCLSPYYDHRAE